MVRHRPHHASLHKDIASQLAEDTRDVDRVCSWLQRHDLSREKNQTAEGGGGCI